MLLSFPMSTRATEALDPAVAARATRLPHITVAVCGNRRKHEQSFDSLRVEAEAHNHALYRSLAHGEDEDDGAGAPRASGGSPQGIAMIPSQLSSASIPRVLIRVVNLNYDAIHQRLVLCTDPSARGEVLPHGSQPGEWPREGAPPPLSYHLSPVPFPSSTAATDIATAANEGADTLLCRQDGLVAPSDVDVLLHKVASFGDERAVVALADFIREAHHTRAAANAKHTHTHTRAGRQNATGTAGAVHWPRPLMVVVDPVDKVELLTRRCMLYTLLDRQHSSGRAPAAIPLTYLWKPPTQPSGNPTITPVGSSSTSSSSSPRTALRKDEEGSRTSSASGPPGERWWIAKPDEGTGPSFTHHLVLWKSEQALPAIPPAVQATLPKEATAFVVQEYYIFSLPVVLKVYVVGEHVFVKVSPTVKLLDMIERQLNKEGGLGQRARTGLYSPVFMDSQNKEMFTAAGLLTASRSASTTLTPEVSGGAFSQGQESTARLLGVGGGSSQGSITRETAATVAPPISTTPPSPNLAASSPATYEIDSRRSNTTPYRKSERTANPDTLLRTVAPDELWDAFLAPGTPAHKHILQLAHSLSAPDSGLGLTLYGFDIVLLPRHLAHEHQRATCPRGFGCSNDDNGEVFPLPAAKVGEEGGAAGERLQRPGTVFAFGPDSMFDLETGAPTRLLLESVPVIIDVNYFPGYKGMATANANILETICRRVMEQTRAESEHHPTNTP